MYFKWNLISSWSNTSETTKDLLARQSLTLWHKRVNQVSRYYIYKVYTEWEEPWDIPLHDTMPVRCEVDELLERSFVRVGKTSLFGLTYRLKWNLISSRSNTSETTKDLLARQSLTLWHKRVNQVSRYYTRFIQTGKNPGDIPLHDTMPVRCEVDDLAHQLHSLFPSEKL